MSQFDFDLVVIGSGPGGYIGAIRAAQLGLRVAVIEKDSTLGGTCLNVGCIPSKALLESSEHFASALHDFKNHGIHFSQTRVDLSTMMGRKDKIVKDLTQGIAFLFKKNKIQSLFGFGKILDIHRVQVTSQDGTIKEISAQNILIATGSVPVELPFLKYDEQKIVSSTGALSLERIPEKMVVVGGGVIGLELGSVWQRLGAQVTVIEYSDRLVATMDKDCIQVLQKNLQKSGMSFLLSTKVTQSEILPDGVQITYENLIDGKAQSIKTDVVLVSTGRKPFTTNLGCEEMGLEKDPQGRLNVNAHYQTRFPNIYAIGDVIKGPMLAHKAEEEGVAVAEWIATGVGHVNYNTVPSVIYTHPEVASVGMTEDIARENGFDVRVGKFPFMANGRAKALGFTDGFVKIVADAKTDRILGGHIVGPRASELIGEIIVTMEFGGSSEDLARSFHAHPTLNEVIREAALAVEGRARQM
ncbi:MAG TPA: dihydrolipoyl dehydrogenase [Pseudobdellovibrionaceae bacterium]|nr:dihydrolipoyl dehydrogenase [Pseudobdellovibrionaceae bacterium]